MLIITYGFVSFDGKANNGEKVITEETFWFDETNKCSYQSWSHNTCSTFRELRPSLWPEALNWHNFLPFYKGPVFFQRVLYYIFAAGNYIYLYVQNSLKLNDQTIRQISTSNIKHYIDIDIAVFPLKKCVVSVLWLILRSRIRGWLLIHVEGYLFCRPFIQNHISCCNMLYFYPLIESFSLFIVGEKEKR